jgi:hypothetical protein
VFTALLGRLVGRKRGALALALGIAIHTVLMGLRDSGGAGSEHWRVISDTGMLSPIQTVVATCD